MISKYGEKNLNFGHRYDRNSPFKRVKPKIEYTRSLSDERLTQINKKRFEENRRNLILQLAQTI